jgi:hypothetical protein
LTELADIAQDPDNAEPEELFNTILESINSFDTTVLQVILNDEDAQKSASPDALAGASLALVAQVLKRESENLDFDDLGDLFDENGNFDSNENISQKSKDDLRAVKAIYNLFESEENLTLFGMSLEDLFGGN